MDETSDVLDLSSSGATGSSSTGGGDGGAVVGGVAATTITSRNLSINTGTTTDGPSYAGKFETFYYFLFRRGKLFLALAHPPPPPFPLGRGGVSNN